MWQEIADGNIFTFNKQVKVPIRFHVQNLNYILPPPLNKKRVSQKSIYSA
jgi:hypothetical protein